MEEKTLSLALCETLKSESVDCISDLAEVGLDSILEDSLFKDVPIISTAISLYKIGNGLKDRYNLKKTFIFINEMNKGIADEEQRQEYRTKFKNNDNFRNQEIEYLLVLIDRYISYDKPKMLAKIYLAYLDDTLTWEEVTMYSEIVDRFIYGDLQMLKEGNQYSISSDFIPDALLRLISLGLMVEVEQSFDFSVKYGKTTIPALTRKDYALTSFGAKLIKILI